MSDEVDDFSHADKQSFLQVVTNFFYGLVRHAQSSQASLQHLCYI